MKVLSMIEIDGSYGEGGGQILRTSVALSALTMRPVRISKIRAGRPKPGLKKQHMAGIELVAQLVGAEVNGLEVGSSQINFVPKERSVGHFKYDIGTAGAISLVLQAALPAAVLSPEPVTFSLIGGTDVKWSPPIDYMREVFAKQLAKIGSRIDISLKKRGHYPRGGGRVSCEVTPVDVIKPMESIEFGEILEVEGISHCVRLPSHVARRQAASAETLLQENSIRKITIEKEYYPKGSDKHLGPGSGIVLWTESESGARIGADALGERGIRAEDVGKSCAQHLLNELSTGMAVDSHLADMLVPYLALADGESKLGITSVTEHLRTNIWASKQFLDSKIELEEKPDGTGLLVVEGVGLTLRN
jgi:RNA 3'-phosphate cyclase